MLQISSNEQRKLDSLLRDLMDSSQKSLVSLRKKDYQNFYMDIEELAISITAFMLQAGEDVLPTTK